MKRLFSFEYPTTYSLITVMVVLFLMTMFFDIITAGNLNFAEILVFFGGENLPLVLDGEIWRLVTAAFLHADLIHIAMNLYSIWFIGRYIESFFGSRNLLSIFIFSAIGGSLFSLLVTFASAVLGFATFDSALATVSVGASGGLFGYMGFLIGSKMRRDPYTPDLPIDERSLIPVVIINLLYGFMVPGINNWAHIGGLITGILLSFVLKSVNSFSKNKISIATSNFLFISAIIIVVLSFISHILFLIFSL